MSIRCSHYRKLKDPVECRQECELYEECEDIKKWIKKNGIKESKLKKDSSTAKQAMAVLDISGAIICNYCPKCSREVMPGQHYCWFCGLKVVAKRG